LKPLGSNTTIVGSERKQLLPDLTTRLNASNHYNNLVLGGTQSTGYVFGEYRREEKPPPAVVRLANEHIPAGSVARSVIAKQYFDPGDDFLAGGVNKMHFKEISCLHTSLWINLDSCKRN
jgi:hypothetical protein